MPVIIDKDLVDFGGVDVVNYQQRPEIYTPNSWGTRPKEHIKRIILHWTGGERQSKDVVEYLNSQNYGCHFIIDKDGSVFQSQNLNIKTAHASGDNYASIGIEIVNIGLLSEAGGKIPEGRSVYEDTYLGRPTKLLTFTPAQIDSAKKICKNLCQIYGIPYDVPRDKSNQELLLKERFGSRQEIDNYTGICGHYHVDIERNFKPDPGTDLLTSILEEAKQNPALQQSTPSYLAELPQPEVLNSGPAGERIKEMTSDRFASPPATFPYYITATKEEDFTSLDYNSAGSTNIDSLKNLLPLSTNAFYNQVMSLKSATTLEMSEAVPVLGVWIRTKKGTINLNDLIFSRPQLSDVLKKEGVSNYKYNLGDRPIASLESFSLNIQGVSVGGPTAYYMGTLNIKVHNPHRLNEKDEQGQHVVNLMKQGYHSRIKFGVNHNFPDSKNQGRLRQAFQWHQEDFVTTQYKMTVNDDLTMNISIDLVPSSNKLFGQITIGENLPVDQVVLEDATKDIKDPTAKIQTQQVILTHNKTISPNDYSLIESSPNSISTRPETIGQAIRGFLNNETIADLNLSDPTIKTNYVNALKTLQAQLLVNNIERMFRENCYLFYSKGKEVDLKYPAINVGPLFNWLVRPEIQRVIESIGKSSINIGKATSLEPQPESESESKNQNAPPKKVLFLYGKFNSLAGQYAGKPISTFPVNTESILSYFREQRDVGNFAGTVNQFIERISYIIKQPENFIPTSDEQIEIPNIKYSFYKSPVDKDTWIFYVFDIKEDSVRFTNFFKKTKGLSEPAIKSLCEKYKIPYIEIGSGNTFIKNASGNSISDELIMANNFYLANNPTFTQRQADAAKIPSGISREFLFGKQPGLTQTVEYHTIVLPLQVSLECYLLLNAELYSHIYIFFPLKQLSGLYTINSLKHEIKNGQAETSMTLIIQQNGIAKTI